MRSVCLTFDDGPHKEHTPHLLDILKEKNIRSIFFVLGEKLEDPDCVKIIRRMLDEGHLVGNHSYSHPDLTLLGEEGIRNELEKAHDKIVSISNECSLFRPPYGYTNYHVQKVSCELGYTQMLWNVDTFDWKLKTFDAWGEAALQQISFRTRSLVLLHDIHRTTIEGVQYFIEAIKRQDNIAFTLPERYF